jgi:ATP-binding cassette subfamily B protein
VTKVSDDLQPVPVRVSRLLPRRQLIIPASLGLIAATCLGLLIIIGSLTLRLIIELPATAETIATTSQVAPSAEPELSPLQRSLLSGPMTSVFRILKSDRRPTFVILAAVIAALTCRWIFQWLAGITCAKNAAKIVQNLRRTIHRKAILLETGDLTGDFSETTDRIFRDTVEGLEVSAGRWSFALATLIPDLVVCLLLSLAVHPVLALEVLFPVFLCWFMLRMESERSRESLSLLAEQARRELRRLAEGLRKSRIIAGFTMEAVEQKQFDVNLARYRSRCQQLRNYEHSANWVRHLIMLFGVVVPGYFLLRCATVSGNSDPAACSIIASSAVMIFIKLHRWQTAQQMQDDCSVRLEEVNNFLKTHQDRPQLSGQEFIEPLSKTLHFDQVSFSTSNHPGLLQNLDLRIQSGETVSIISIPPLSALALVSTVPRFIEPESGQVLIDGRDIRQGTLESLRAEVIVVGGNDPVFNTTIFENITCGQQDITRQQVLETCKLVHADQFIRQLPRGYDADVGEHGATLDIGQKFRLSLARAAVRKPAVLIIEEPHESLDAESRTLIDDAYQRLITNRTVLFLPTRLSTVRRSDRVVLIHEGRVVADDTYDRLVRSCELYRHWEYLHFNTFRTEA